MSVIIGMKLGPYEILAPLGAGGIYWWKRRPDGVCLRDSVLEDAVRL